MELDKAMREAFDKKSPKRFRKFKKKYRCLESFRCPQGIEIGGGHIPPLEGAGAVFFGAGQLWSLRKTLQCC